MTTISTAMTSINEGKSKKMDTMGHKIAATMEPSDTYPVRLTIMIKTTRQMSAGTGLI